ncbi:hypothetical protein [Paenibacillus tyrfis]|uniref:YhfM-like domain-containing protein n=1 Tax=Paenibacillus tyrfis TaxID=1501230 RepID=A0A081NWE4_9BACL|nr:hypothetical protein [Paenibacillus tyrfis]KEQ22767.1 hypothetical protein ET33_20640 [Paenibacillus tyrfis]
MVLFALWMFGIFAGCESNTNNLLENKAISSIDLECKNQCTLSDGTPFIHREFKEEAELKLFTDAIKKAEKMPGILDYFVILEMRITFEDRTSKMFYLNISNSTDLQTGLLIEQSKSEQGYQISSKISERLRETIYKTTAS